METIRNYLEAMFANLPNTTEVKKAKAELLNMMEDKYNELINDGLSENSAVGTVISEFGNLDELAEDLGLTKEVEETRVREASINRRFLRNDEVLDYLNVRKASGLMVGVGVMLCILSVCFPILTAFVDFKNAALFSLMGMFLSIGIAIALFVFSGVRNSEWHFLTSVPCQIDMATAAQVREKRKTFKIAYAFMIALGVMLCSICWLPIAVMRSGIFVISIFTMVAAGVFLFIFSSHIMGIYDTLLKLNDSNTISGSYGKENEVEYVSKAATAVMEVYWTTITCVYLIISFITFRWDISWIIWPIAAVLHKILEVALVKED
ncbi:MAG: hypothetical protein J6033_01325 [Lachnospiraceae bacterium]|nr:hypothetical protein [Lachnospiraceae bacterium]